ncbi:porin [Paludibacterium denitrificans]|uniref:porin n=1 Tax=Paludibacterium denitrificans TaxID=2675226 RepID=UPI002477D4ED|nr:porin [Paludibacterium denitrificans]
MGDTTAENNGASSTYSRGEARLVNSIHYFSPTWNGFKFGASYGADETRAYDANLERTNRQVYSLGANYVNGGLTVAGGYNRTNDTAFGATAANGKNLTFYKLAGSYKFATGTFVGAGYEFGRFDTTTDTKLKQDDWTVVVGQTFGAATVSLSYSEIGKLRNATTGSDSDYKAKQWTLGGTYALSKSTSLYGYYTKINNNKLQNANFANNPVYDTGSGSSAAVLTKGNDPQAIGVGMKVAF